MEETYTKEQQVVLMENTIENLKTKERESWKGGPTGEQRATQLEGFLRSKLKEYSEAFNLPEAAILEAWEKKRTYSAINYYQECNFPSLDGVRVYDTWDDLAALIPSKQFRCAACEKITTHPYTCNSGHVDEDGKVCDWKTWGFFRSMGKGLRFTLKDSFLEKGGLIDEIFMPIEFES